MVFPNRLTSSFPGLHACRDLYQGAYHHAAGPRSIGRSGELEFMLWFGFMHFFNFCWPLVKDVHALLYQPRVHCDCNLGERHHYISTDMKRNPRCSTVFIRLSFKEFKESVYCIWELWVPERSGESTYCALPLSSPRLSSSLFQLVMTHHAVNSKRSGWCERGTRKMKLI